MIQYFLIVHSTETARFIFGPLPVFICHLQNVARYAIVDMIVMSKAISILTKYLFIIWLKNPAGFNDEFWASFAWLWIQSYSYLVEFTTFFLSTGQSATFYICCGTDRTTEQKNSYLPRKAGNSSSDFI